MRKALALPVVAIAAAAFPLLGITGASAADSSSYQTQLKALNGSGASGTVMLELKGTQATVTEHVKGVAATFNGNPYPHVQHIHGGAKGQCPTTADDKDGDGVISTTEGGPAYGEIKTTLSKSGDTSPAAGTTLEVAPSGATFDYSRTFEMDQATISALKAGTAVVVVHGLDPATLPAAAQSKPSDLVPSLPLAATSPALCGALTASQMNMPNGAAATGGGSTAGIEDAGVLATGAGLIAVGAAAGAMAMRRRRTSEN